MAAANPKKDGRSGGLLRGARVYLSGPMDFVADREDEKKNGWRARIGNVLRDLGAIVFDPWNKPEVRGLHEYGKRVSIPTRIAKSGPLRIRPTAQRRARS